MKFAWKRIFKKVHSNDHTLIGAMEEIVEAKANLKRRKEYSPFRAFPDVSSVRIEVSIWDPLFQKYGLKRRSAPGTMHYVKYENKSLNRYKLRCIKRLKKNKNNNKIYWSIVCHLLLRSRIFFLDALRHVNPHFHRNMKFFEVLKLWKEYKKVAHASWPEIDYKRVYILKTNNIDYRGLGVPTMVWRIYLHLLNQFLVLKFDDIISPSQHGFRPFRGTLTAWIQVLKLVKKYLFIYEFDYKGFFPNVDVLTVSTCLTELKVPKHIVMLIQNLNKSLPKLPIKKKRKMDESQVIMSKTKSMGNKINNVFLDERARPQSGFQTLQKWGSNGPMMENSKLWGNTTTFLGMGLDLSDWKVHIDHHPIIGLPQGAPTSPFLSILVLDWATKKLKGKFVRYADDGLIFSNEPLTHEINNKMREANIHIAENKSGYVKYEGNWLKVLKFLGITYDGTKDQLAADTRNGSKLIMDKEDLIQEFNKRETGYEEKFSEWSWNSFIHSELAGYIQSRLYSGSWELEQYFQNFRLKYGKGSWVQKYLELYKDDKLGEKLNTIKLSVFNSSSICLKTFLEAMKDYERFSYRVKTLKKGTKKEYSKVLVQPKKLHLVRKFLLGL